MDVNDTRFHFLLTRQDWERQYVSLSSPAAAASSEEERPTPDLAWDANRLSLGLHPRLFHFPTPPGDKALQPEDRRGAGRDRYGNWYWIAAAETEILFRGAAGQGAEHFWAVEAPAEEPAAPVERGDFRPAASPAAPPALSLRGLTVTTHHYLVVGVSNPPGLLIFDLRAGGPPLHKTWPRQIPLAPFDLAPAPDGGVWLLDYDPDQPERLTRYWALDRYFRVIGLDQERRLLEPAREADFQPQNGPAEASGRRPRFFPGGVSLALSSPLEEIERPLAIEALPDGSVLILAQEPAAADLWLYRYRFGRRIGPPVSLSEAAAGYNVDPAALGGHDFAVVPASDSAPGRVAGTLYLAAADGNQAYAFDLVADDANLTLDLTLRPDYYPMRLYSGKGLVAAGETVYYDLQDRWLPLARQPRPRYKTAGRLESEIFDGRTPDCVWHRLFLEACIPAEAGVGVESRAADDIDLLGQTPWQAEPPLYRRGGGAELPYYRPFSGEPAGREEAGVWELLFQQARGRFLQVRLTLTGNGQRTPWLRALRLYYPRFSYLKAYLPAVYQRDEISAAFLDRFLANVEGMYTVLEGKIAQAQILFDPEAAPAEYLDWLAGWFGLSLEQDWPEAKRRFFLRHAIELFDQRGTPAGIIRAVRLALDPCPDDSLFTEDVTACSSGQATACAAENRTSPFTVRLVEGFLTRSRPGVIYGDPTDRIGPGLTTTQNDWSPAQGVEPLHRRYRAYLQERYRTPAALATAWEREIDDFDEILLSPVPPASANAAAGEDWRTFTRRRLGFFYAEVSAADAPLYRTFLRQRYDQIAALNSAYARAYAGFKAIDLPAEDDFPRAGPRLRDWIQFVSLFLPLKRRAHRFTVLAPTPLRTDRAALAQQVDLVRRVVAMEKPAHTNFEVKQYWALFRVGEARLGLDTVLEAGSRFAALILGDSYLTGGYLAPAPPWNAGDRGLIING